MGWTNEGLEPVPEGAHDWIISFAIHIKVMRSEAGEFTTLMPGGLLERIVATIQDGGAPVHCDKCGLQPFEVTWGEPCNGTI